MLARVQQEEVHDRAALRVLQEGEHAGRENFVHLEPWVAVQHLCERHSQRLVPALGYDVIYQSLDVERPHTVVAAHFFSLSLSLSVCLFFSFCLFFFVSLFFSLSLFFLRDEKKNSPFF